MEIVRGARYSEEPAAMTYEPRGDGTADAWLRRSVERDVADMGPDGQAVEFWTADELRLVTTLTREELEWRADELWARAEAGEVPADERIAALEASLEPMPAVYALARMRAASLTDEQALEVPALYDEWSAGTDYAAGVRVRHAGGLWRCLQAHASQAGWEPGAAPSLWARVLPGQSGEVGEWERPGATNGYSKGDRVTHNGKVWESTADANVWEPGDVGAPWVEVA